MKTLACVAAVFALGTAAAVAQGLAPPAAGVPLPATSFTDATKIPAGAYTLDGRHMSLLWRIRHMGVSLFVGRIDAISGKLVLDPADFTKSTVNVTIKTDSVSTNVVDATGAHAFDRIIAAQALKSATYPEATFVSKSVQLTGPGKGLVAGDLTLNGVTRPVVMEVTFDGGAFVSIRNRHIIALTARTVIKRSDFGARLSDKVRDDTVGDEVELILSGEFSKDPA